MGKTEGSFEKNELTDKGWFGKAMAYKFGKKGIEALEDGVWCIAEAFKGRELTTGMDKTEAKEELILLMEEAARKCDGRRLRLLAYAVEARKQSSVHDPLRAWILTMAPHRTFGVEFPAARPPQTAQEIQDSIRRFYPPGEVPTPKNIREVACELGVTLPKKKSGAPKGVPHKKPVPHKAGCRDKR